MKNSFPFSSQAHALPLPAADQPLTVIRKRGRHASPEPVQLGRQFFSRRPFGFRKEIQLQDQLRRFRKQ